MIAVPSSSKTLRRSMLGGRFSHRRRLTSVTSLVLSWSCIAVTTLMTTASMGPGGGFSIVSAFSAITRSPSYGIKTATPVVVQANIASRSQHLRSSSTKTKTSLNLFNNFIRPKEQVPVIPPAEPGIGEDGCRLPSPSGINMLSDGKQIGVFVTYFVLLGLGVAVVEPLLDLLATTFGPVEFSTRYVQPVTIGLVYVLAGVTHFTVREEYMNIMPYQGAWGGLWRLPGTSSFHVGWTGVAELLGGLGLWVGSYYEIFQPVFDQSPNVITNAGILSDSAACLFLLTLAVTPANIYMYTHGARLPMAGPPVGVEFHYVRFGFQILLLSLLLQMGGGSFDALLAVSEYAVGY